MSYDTRQFSDKHLVLIILQPHWYTLYTPIIRYFENTSRVLSSQSIFDKMKLWIRKKYDALTAEFSQNEDLGHGSPFLQDRKTPISRGEVHTELIRDRSPTIQASRSQQFSNVQTALIDTNHELITLGHVSRVLLYASNILARDI